MINLISQGKKITMSVCTECSTIPDYECKSCTECSCSYCSTLCRAEHLRRCPLLRRLPRRDGELSEKFIRKPGFAARLDKWRYLATCCMLCYGRGDVARSGDAVLCAACYSDFVLGKREKRKRPPPKFDISEWVSAEDMEIVNEDRRDRAEVMRMYDEMRRRDEEIERTFTRMRQNVVVTNDTLVERRIASMSDTDAMCDQLLGIWDATRSWVDVIHAHDILVHGGELPVNVPPRTRPGIITAMWKCIKDIFCRRKPKKRKMKVAETVETGEPWCEDIPMVRPPARRRRRLISRVPRPRLPLRADNVADMTEVEREECIYMRRVEFGK